MKKKTTIILVTIIVVYIFIFLTINNKANKSSTNNELNNETNVSDTKKYEYKAFTPSFKKSSNDIGMNYDYTQDMTYSNKIYYRKLNTFEEYNEVKARWNGILDMNESDFNDKFMVITAIENNDMTGLTVDKVETDGNGLYISLIHYDENETCISYVISRELERDNIYVTRNLRDFEKDMSKEMQIASLNDSFGTINNFTYQYKNKLYRDAYEREKNQVNSKTRLVPVEWKDCMVQNFTIDKAILQTYLSNNWENLGGNFYSITLTKHSDYLKMVNNYNAPNLYWNEFEYIFAIIVFRMHLKLGKICTN